jgi:hypothetical protein
MTNPHTEQLSELIITDYSNKVNYVLVIFDHSLVFRVMVPYAACIQCDLLKMSIYGSKHVEECNII